MAHPNNESVKNATDKRERSEPHCTKRRMVSYHRLEAFRHVQAKLYDDTINTDADNNTYYLDDNVQESLDWSVCEVTQFQKIRTAIANYKLKYNVHGENYNGKQTISTIYTIICQQITMHDIDMITNAVISLQNTGKVSRAFIEKYNNGTVFYKRKDKLKPGTGNNQRGLINANNCMKLLYRYIKDNFLEQVFTQGHVDQKIHVAKLCVVKEKSSKKDSPAGDSLMYSKLKFESIARLASAIHKTVHPYVILDLENAYGNVRWVDIRYILTEYLTRVHGNKLGYNLATGLTTLLTKCVYTDPVLDEQLKHNKGLPQGSPISMDLFIICMDYIIRRFITSLDEEFGIRHDIDYQLQIYVDDILMFLMTSKAQSQVNVILARLETLFGEFHFKLNTGKSVCSLTLARDNQCMLPTIMNEHKYLGLYVETDPCSYLKIVEREIAHRWQHNPRFRTLEKLNSYIKSLIENNESNCYKAKSADARVVKQLRGKLQYRLTPFAVNVQERHTFMTAHGYPALADILFSSEL